MRADLPSRVAHSALWTFTLRFGSHIAALVQTLVLARLLTPTDFGLFGIAVLVLSMLETVSEPGFRDALVQRRDDIATYLDTFWTVSLIRGVVLAGLVVISAGAVADFFGEASARPYVTAIALVPLVNGAVNPGTVFFQKDLQFRNEFWFRSVGVFSGLLVAIPVALVWRSPWALVLAMVATGTVQAAASYVAHPYRPAWELDRTRLKEMFAFGKWMTGSAVLKYLITNLPDVALGKVAGATTLGGYQMASRLATVPGNEIIYVVRRVAFPAFSELQADPVRLARSYLASQRLTAFVILPLTGIMIVLAERLVEAFLGAAWLSIVPSVQILALIGLLQAIGAYGELLKAVGRPQIVTGISFVRLTIVAALVYPMIDAWGMEGAALSFLLGTVLTQPIAVYYSLQAIDSGVRELAAVMAPSLVSSLAMVVVIGVLGPALDAGVISLVILGTTGTAVYLLASFILDQITGRPLASSFRPVLDVLRTALAKSELTAGTPPARFVALRALARKHPWLRQVALAGRGLRTRMQQGLYAGRTYCRMISLYGLSQAARLQRIDRQSWQDGAPINRRIHQLLTTMGATPVAGSATRQGWLYHDYALPETHLPAHRRNTARRLAHLKKRVPWARSRVLDIGCSSGGMSLGFALLGASHVVGVDHDDTAIRLAQAVAEKYGITNAEFICAPLSDFDLPRVDIVAWLSQWMWMVKDRGLEYGRDLLYQVPVRAGASFMVFESAAGDGKAAIPGTSQHDIEAMLADWSPFTVVRSIGPFPDEWRLAGQERNVFVCSQPRSTWPGKEASIRRLDRFTVIKEYEPSRLWAKALEARCLERLKGSRHIPRLLDVGETWIKMEWAGNRVTRVAQLAHLDRIVEILASHRIVHRDICPENLTYRDGELFLLDFGWAVVDDEPTPVSPPPTLGRGYYRDGSLNDAAAARHVRAALARR